jgi:hypothetical protein
MSKTSKYKGRIITVDLREAGGGWLWSYTIDNGEMCVKWRATPHASEKLAFQEAIRNAKSAIDAK